VNRDVEEWGDEKEPRLSGLFLISMRSRFVVLSLVYTSVLFALAISTSPILVDALIGTGPIFAEGGLYPQVLWNMTHSIGDADLIAQVLRVDDGYLVLGNTQTWGTGTSSQDIFLFKIDMEGNVVWEKIYGEGNAKDMAPAGEGGVLIAGEYIEGDISNIYLIKVDSSGSKEWERIITEKNSETVAGIVTLTEHGFVIAGYRMIEKTYYHNSARQAFAMKVDGMGEIIWRQTYNEEGSIRIWDITSFQDKGCLIVGTTTDNDPDGDVYALKIDENGQEVWKVVHESNSTQEAFVATSSSDGGFILAGTNGTIPNSIYDILVVKLDSNGQVLWSTVYGGPDYDKVNSIICTEDGAILVGKTRSFGAGGVDAYLLKINNTGYLIWEKMIGGPQYDDATVILRGHNDNFIITGQTSQPVQGTLIMSLTDSPEIEPIPESLIIVVMGLVLILVAGLTITIHSNTGTNRLRD